MTDVIANKDMTNSIDDKEVAKFAAMADEWWDPHGKFRPLHKFNPTRLSFIRENCLKHFGLEDKVNAFAGKKLLDVGCGGGLLSEPMARMGFDVTSIDATEKNIKIASAHRDKMGLNIDYRHTTAEALLEGNEGKFDVVLNMEVIEHVNNPREFLQNSLKLLSPNGIMFVATINRTPKARALALFAAERILKWLPPGTHDYDKLIKPEEIKDFLSIEPSLNIEGPIGVSYNPLFDKWSLSNDASMNYMFVIRR